MNNVIKYLESTTLKNPKKIAVIEEDKKISYKDLTNNSKSVGSFLINASITKEPIVIFMDKGIEALEAFFGCVYAGCSYSLINPEFPSVRIHQIVDVLHAKYVITDDEHIELAKSELKDLEVFSIKDMLKSKIDTKKLLEVEKNHVSIDPLYINFTSGSTGVPKGVVVCHRSVIDFIDVFTSEFNITEDDIIGNQAPFDFDVSVKDIYSAICVGATLVIIPKKYFSSPAMLLDYLVDNDVTTMTWAVSALCLITTFHGLDYKVPTKVNKVIFSGEVMPIKHLNIWMEKLPKATFINVYGPTEITCNCTYHIVERNRDYSEGLPIGIPFHNEKVFLLDENDKLVTEVGCDGEICVSGTCLSLGYFNNPEQNEKHFCQNPLNPYYFEQIYRTGDLGMYMESGELIFRGRKDFQIKHMGHRIELEEIDRAIMSVNGIIRTCTIYDEEKSKIYGFYIGDVDSKELREILSKDLPVYMVPTKLIKMDEFPMNKNGKTDRKELMKIYKENK